MNRNKIIRNADKILNSEKKMRKRFYKHFIRWCDLGELCRELTHPTLKEITLKKLRKYHKLQLAYLLYIEKRFG